MSKMIRFILKNLILIIHSSLLTHLFENNCLNLIIFPILFFFYTDFIVAEFLFSVYKALNLTICSSFLYKGEERKKNNQQIYTLTSHSQSQTLEYNFAKVWRRQRRQWCVCVCVFCLSPFKSVFNKCYNKCRYNEKTSQVVDNSDTLDRCNKF